MLYFSKFSMNLDNAACLYESYFENLGAHELLLCAEEIGAHDISLEMIADIYDNTKEILDSAPFMHGVGEA